jgi:uncharacterized protein YbjT (DUF2867 family)
VRVLATGQYAHHVVTALVAQGIEGRGVVHDPDKADEAHRARATETAQADLTDADGVAAAALLSTTGNPPPRDQAADRNPLHSLAFQ